MREHVLLSCLLGLVLIATMPFVALLAPAAHANEYDVSPYTGAIYPRSSYEPPSAVIIVPPRAFPHTCPLDGPGAWSCDRKHRHLRRRPGPFER